MGARSGSGSGMGGGGLYGRAAQLANKYLGDVKNPALKKELAEGMGIFDKEFGIPGRITVTTKDLGNQILGRINYKSGNIEINSRYEDGRISMDSAKFTMVHELAHSIDKTLDKSAVINGSKIKRVTKPENKMFDKKLTAAYKTFKTNYGNAATKQIGRYALTNSNEFFAESLAHHMTGTKNQYTKYVYNLAKMMEGK